MYRLTVEKFVDPKEVSKREQEFVKRHTNQYGQCPDTHEDFRFEKAITCSLTDEEFAAVKKAVLGVM